jgi:hypothetical protein
VLTWKKSACVCKNAPLACTLHPMSSPVSIPAQRAQRSGSWSDFSMGATQDAVEGACVTFRESALRLLVGGP